MSAHVTRIIHAEPEKVWETLTSRRGMKAYMMGADVETDWQIGSPITMRGEFKGKSFEDTGEVRSFEPQRRLSYTHRSSAAPDNEHLVTVELLPSSEGSTEVSVTQSKAAGGETPADEAQRAEYEKTWAMMLEKLEEAASH